MSTINQLKVMQSLNGDGQRSTKFDAMLFIGEESSEAERKFSHLVKTAQFPSIKLNPIDYKYKGRIIPLTGNPTFENTWTCTLYLQDDHELKVLLEDWMKTSSSMNFKEEEYLVKRKKHKDVYKTIKIHQRNFDDNDKTVVYVLRNVFPKNIQQINIDYSQVGTILELQVDFQYSHFEYEKVNGNPDLDLVNKSLRKLQGKISDAVGNAKGALMNKAVNIKKLSIKANKPTPKVSSNSGDEFTEIEGMHEGGLK